MCPRCQHLIEEALSRSVIGAFYDVYTELGYGFLEHVYAAAVERELRQRGHDVGREVSVAIRYKGELLAQQRLDMLVDSKLVVEIKANRALIDLGARQLLNYLRATSLRVGLVLYFGARPEFKRVVCSGPMGGSSVHEERG